MSDKRDFTVDVETYTCTGYNYYIAEGEFVLHFGVPKGKKGLIPFKVSYMEHRLREGTKVNLDVVANGFVVTAGKRTQVVAHGENSKSAGNYELEKMLKNLLWEEVKVEKDYAGEVKERIEKEFDVEGASFKLNTAYSASLQKQETE